MQENKDKKLGQKKIAKLVALAALGASVGVSALELKKAPTIKAPTATEIKKLKKLKKNVDATKLQQQPALKAIPSTKLPANTMKIDGPPRP